MKTLIKLFVSERSLLNLMSAQTLNQLKKLSAYNAGIYVRDLSLEGRNTIMADQCAVFSVIEDEAVMLELTYKHMGAFKIRLNDRESAHTNLVYFILSAEIKAELTTKSTFIGQMLAELSFFKYRQWVTYDADNNKSGRCGYIDWTFWRSIFKTFLSKLYDLIKSDKFDSMTSDEFINYMYE